MGLLAPYIHPLVGTAIEAALIGVRTIKRSQGVVEALVWPGVLSAVAGLLFFAGLVQLARAVIPDRKPNH